MELTGQVTIDAQRERVWAALNDPSVLQACIPGCEELIDESPTTRKARVMVKIGPVRARFSGRITLSDSVAPERCVIGFEGSGGAAGMASGRSQVELRPDGEATRLVYSATATLGGKLGQIGGRMIDASARQLADQFFAALREQLAPTPTPPAPTPAGAPAPVISAANVISATPAQPAAEAVRLAPPSLERLRVQWFVLGSAATALGVWLGKILF
jgi:carbon monoxide dehydrogenase subunit G